MENKEREPARRHSLALHIYFKSLDIKQNVFKQISVFVEVSSLQKEKKTSKFFTFAKEILQEKCYFCTVRPAL